VAIAQAVAGRFDHYICRRDDNLRERASDEVPRIMARALQAAGVPALAITVIPDEEEAIDAALRMGAPGDLLLVFADALVRSWKQITKFKPAGSPPARATTQFATSMGDELAAPAATSPTPPSLEPATADFSLEGLIRDERGVRLAPEIED
jgi:cyanophycin synthetase